MISLGRFCDRLSGWMMDYCVRNLPAARVDWAEAMRAEFAEIDGSLERLSWATGCFITAYRARRKAMSNSSISRSVLLLAWVFSFAFLTFAFIVWIPLAYTNLTDAEMMHAYSVDRQPIFFVISAMELLRCLIGPVGLVLIYRLLANETRTDARVTITLIGVLILCGVALQIAYAYQAGWSSVFSHWREFVLLSVLPSIALAHMHLFSAHRDTEESLAV